MFVSRFQNWGGSTAGVYTSDANLIFRVAGDSRLLYQDGRSLCTGTINFGSGPSESPASTPNLVVTPAEIAGAGVGLEAVVNEVDGSQSVAGGRVRKYSTGILRLEQKYQDALYGDHPRLQWWQDYLPTGAVLRIVLHIAFGDAGTPWPAYVGTTADRSTFLQLKDNITDGGLGPTMFFWVDYDTDMTNLKVSFSRRTTKAGSVSTLGSLGGLAKNTVHRIVLDVRLDTAATGMLRAYVNETLIGSVDGPTMATDGATILQPMVGIYRTGYTSVQAPDGMAVVVHQYTCHRQ